MEKTLCTYLLSPALCLSILVSPETQALLGNGFGMNGWWMVVALFFTMGIQLLTIKACRVATEENSNEVSSLAAVIGQPLALFFPLAGRVFFFMSLSTILLVTAGFIFNEVFFYWFPNFAFAFLLLGVIVAVNLVGRGLASVLQVSAVILALLSMLVLVGVGLFAGESGTLAAGAPEYAMRGFLLPLFMMVGVDLFVVSAKDSSSSERDAMVGLVIVVFILALWGIVMTQNVALAKLANSFNPHMRTARQIWGQPGRIIAGVMVISGVVAAVNGLLLCLTHQIADLVKEKKLPGLLGLGGERQPIPKILLAMGPALLMGLGYAGEEITDVYNRAAMVLVLFGYSAVHITMFVQGVSCKRLHLLAGVMLVAGGVGLLVTDPEKLQVVQCFVYLSFAAGILSIMFYYLRKSTCSVGCK